ncbi:MAG TPA: glycoside hydrolase family 13 protein [Bacteroidales bacterium]|nr:glycoside hydrolase family 13 protein [Bacteroidales bacterium]HRZ49513.1 glycoside hydrolase family 13 protein [Bacteroidales bacterium]
MILTRFSGISLLIILFFIYIGTGVSEAQVKIERLEPPCWWTGMSDPSLQLLVYGKGISSTTPSVQYPGVLLDSVVRTGNPDYLFLYLSISPNTAAGKLEILFAAPQKGKKKPPVIHHPFELKSRETGSAQRQGFTSSDVIYMLMPDRFANGDPANDSVGGMLEKANRSNPDGRHGGDIRGIRNHIGYFRETGITALWINPLLENNMHAYSYHGYAATDFYSIDPRFGTLDEYLSLSDELRKNGIGLIADMVFNHCGLNHWWMNNLPTSTWIHQWPEFTRSNYRAESLMDPYAAASDQKEMLEGWFDRGMPDLNQQDPLLATYLIQNSIWWIETAGLTGIRMDTWPYVDAGFTEKWIDRIREEYPKFSVLGETWLQKEAHTSWFQQNPATRFNSGSNLTFLTDFPLSYAINRAFRDEDSWTGGLYDLYYVLSQDFLYANPKHLMTFVDNHDVQRFYSNQGDNYNLWDLGMTFLFTTRGIPVIYYGTEILMEGEKSKGDADLRKDFPGGWADDTVSVLLGRGFSADQMKALNRFRQLVKLRTEGIYHQGDLVHFVPRDGVYVYGWSHYYENLLVILNKNSSETLFDPERFRELTGGKTLGIEYFTQEVYSLDKPFVIPPQKPLVLYLK